MVNVKLKNTIGFTLGIFIFFTMGCERELNEIIAQSDDATVVDGETDKKPSSGSVVIVGSAKKFGTDRYVLNDARITDDILTINVSYGGGCQTHRFTLIASDSFLESFPVQLRITLAHNANGDLCRAWLTEDYHFDLTPIKTMYQKAYRQAAGTIILRLKDAPDGELVYEFSM
jgi:hypothetical protein